MVSIKKKISIYHLLIILLFLFIVVNQIIFILASQDRYIAFRHSIVSPPYISSALELLNSGKAVYYRHPGVPYYIFLAFALLPLKLYAMVSNIDLIEFVYLNIEPILLYLQFVTMFAFLAGLYLVSRTVVRLTKTQWSGLLFVFVFFATHPENTRQIGSIICERFLIFISGPILYYFGRYICAKQDARSLHLSLCLLGIGFASKLTILPLGIFMILYPFYELIRRRINSEELLIFVIKYLFLVLSGFIVGVIVLGRRIRPFLSCMHRFVTHNTGLYDQGIIDSAAYLRNLGFAFKNHSLIIIVSISLIMLFLYSCLAKKKDFLKRDELWIGLVGIMSLAIYFFVAAKDIAQRYLIVTFLLSAFSVSLILPVFFTNKYLRYLKFAVLIVIFLWAFNAYQSGMSRKLRVAKGKENVEALLRIGELDSKNDKIVYSSGVSTKEHFFMIGNAYSSHIYDKVIEKYQPNFFRYQGKKIRVRGTWEEHKGMWDYAIISNKSREEFMNKYPSRIVAQKGNFSLLESAK